jgi:hypothetical protein
MLKNQFGQQVQQIFVDSKNQKMTGIPVGEHAGVPAPVEQVSACYSQVARHMPEDEEMGK